MKKRQSSRHPEEVLSGLAYADDIALLENVFKEEEDLLLNLNPPSDDQMLYLDESEIEKVDDFLYLGSYTETSHDIDTRIGKAWGPSMLFLKCGYVLLRK